MNVVKYVIVTGSISAIVRYANSMDDAIKWVTDYIHKKNLTVFRKTKESYSRELDGASIAIDTIVYDVGTYFIYIIPLFSI